MTVLVFICFVIIAELSNVDCNLYLLLCANVILLHYNYLYILVSRDE